MILDTSALAAIFFGESEAALFTQLIHAADRCLMSAANFLELSIVVEGQIGPEAGRQCDIFFRRAGIIIEDPGCHTIPLVESTLRMRRYPGVDCQRCGAASL